MSDQLKAPPYSEEAEKALLGSILLDPRRMNEMTAQPEDFFDGRHALIWGEMQKISIKTSSWDAITFWQHLSDNNLLDKIGGERFLVSLQDSAIVTGHAEHYQDIIFEKHNLRKVIGLGSEMAENGFRGVDISSEVVARIIANKTHADKTIPLPELGRQFIEECKAETCGTFPWPFAEWNNIHGRLSDEIVILLAGRSTGKTALTIQWMREAHLNGLRMPLASLESPREQIVRRIISLAGQVNSLSMKSRKPTAGEERQALAAIDEMEEFDYSIDDSQMTIDDLHRWAAREVDNGADALVIDNLLSISEGKFSSESKTLMYDQFFREFRKIRNRFKIPIIVLAHPNAEGKVAWSTDAENFADIILKLVKTWGKKVEIAEAGITIEPLYNNQGNHVIALWPKSRDGRTDVAASLDFVGEHQTFSHVQFEE